MLDLTPIPDPYLVAVVVVAAAAPGAVSGLVSSATRTQVTWFLPVHVGVMAAVLALAGTAFGVSTPSWPSAARALAVVAAGLGVFGAAVAAERGVAAWVRHRGGYVRQGSWGGASAVFVVTGRVASGDAGPRFVLGWLVAVAIGEELLYRGVLLDLVLAAPLPLVMVGVPLSVMLFAAAHLSLGPGNAVTMLALAGGATAAVLLLGSLLPAVLGHVAYNVRAGRALR